MTTATAVRIAVAARSLVKVYRSGETGVRALDEVTLEFGTGEFSSSLVRRLGLEARLGHKPSQLSGGQQQRVACASALISRPEVVFADEPTGNLDSASGAELLAFLRSSVRELHQTVIMVTHDPIAASYAGRVVFLADGRPSGELRHPTPSSVLAMLNRRP